MLGEVPGVPRSINKKKNKSVTLKKVLLVSYWKAVLHFWKRMIPADSAVTKTGTLAYDNMACDGNFLSISCQFCRF